MAVENGQPWCMDAAHNVAARRYIALSLIHLAPFKRMGGLKVSRLTPLTLGHARFSGSSVVTDWAFPLTSLAYLPFFLPNALRRQADYFANPFLISNLADAVPFAGTLPIFN